MFSHQSKLGTSGGLGIMLIHLNYTNYFKFQSLDDAIGLLKAGYYMAKIDLRHAYRTVHIHPDNYQATGLKWKFENNNNLHG